MRSHIDTVSFILQDEGDMKWLDDLPSVFAQVGELTFTQRKHGKNRYSYGGVFTVGKAIFAEVNWGGNNQNAILQLMLKGVGCSLINDWSEVVSRLLELPVCKLSRVDVALDVFDGSLTLENVWKLRKDRRSWTGAKGGKAPKFMPIGDMAERGPYGRTIYIGTRDSDLYTRVYEKGLQLFSSLRDTSSQPDPRQTLMTLQSGAEPFLCGDYVRFEVEFKAKTVILPLSVLLDPDSLLAGAYPFCQQLLDHQSPFVRLRQEHVVLTELNQILRQIRRQYGPSLRSAINVFGERRVLDLIVAPYANSRLAEHGINLAEPKNLPVTLDPAELNSFIKGNK